jgi:hypothetical protein
LSDRGGVCGKSEQAGLQEIFSSVRMTRAGWTCLICRTAGMPPKRLWAAPPLKSYPLSIDQCVEQLFELPAQIVRR